MAEKQQNILEKRIYDLIIPKQRRPDFVLYINKMKNTYKVNDMKTNYIFLVK